MSIANELSSDVAAAVLARNDQETAQNANALKDVVINVHSTLRHLTTAARKRGRRLQSSPEPQATRAASNP